MTVIKLTETSLREWTCLSGEGEEEDGLGCVPQESLSGQNSCRQTPRLLQVG